MRIHSSKPVAAPNHITYGFPLAAEIKRMGRIAIHLGGVTQIMFGVIGSRDVFSVILILFPDRFLERMHYQNLFAF